jgi:xanthine dehydrogenase accessory factor
MKGSPVDGWDVVEQAGELARRGEEFAMATVVWRQGPSSGQSGSRAIITSSGQLYGWIGGACAEPVVIREAQRAIVEREPKLLLLGTPEQFGSSVPDGMVVVPISCQSEGALQVFIEPVTPTPHLVIVGRSPMAATLGDLAVALGWRADVVDGPDFSAADLDARSIVVIATQGHGDEDAVEQAISAFPAFVGLVASRRRGEAVLGYLADRGVPQNLIDRVNVPVGLDLGHTSHREIAVAILAELVRKRAGGLLVPEPDPAAALTGDASSGAGTVEDVIDPVCGMTVRADRSSFPVEHAGQTYYFCRVVCRDTFVKDPTSYVDGPAQPHDHLHEPAHDHAHHHSQEA